MQHLDACDPYKTKTIKDVIQSTSKTVGHDILPDAMDTAVDYIATSVKNDLQLREQIQKDLLKYYDDPMTQSRVVPIRSMNTKRCKGTVARYDPSFAQSPKSHCLGKAWSSIEQPTDQPITTNMH